MSGESGQKRRQAKDITITIDTFFFKVFATTFEFLQPTLWPYIKMGKRSRKDGDSADSKSNGNSNSHSKNPLLPNDKAIDPSLALLFASSVRTSYDCLKNDH